MKKVHVLPLGHRPQNNWALPNSPSATGQPHPWSPTFPKWAAWKLRAPAQCQPLSSHSTRCPRRHSWHWAQWLSGLSAATTHHDKAALCGACQARPQLPPPHLMPPLSPRVASLMQVRKQEHIGMGQNLSDNPPILLPPPSPSSSPWPPSRSHSPKTSHLTGTDLPLE